MSNSLPPGEEAGPKAGSVVLRTSLRGLFSAIATPVGLVTIGVLASGRFGVSITTVGLTGLGVLLAVVLLVDLPHATRFDTTGITRHCIGRLHHIPWADVACLDRTPPRTATVVRNLGARSRGAEREVSGGLVARGKRRRRWLLADRVESRQEHDALRELLAATPEPVDVFASRPHSSATPTSGHRGGRSF